MNSLLPQDSRVSIDDCALSDHEGESIFHCGLDYASQLSDTGRTRVRTRTIDALGLSPTFIKLHLEGAELAALKGARQTLSITGRSSRVTVYHNERRYLENGDWLMETLADYRFLFRNHSWCGTGAVIYAIPQREGSGGHDALRQRQPDHFRSRT